MSRIEKYKKQIKNKINIFLMLVAFGIILKDRSVIKYGIRSEYLYHPAGVS
jgi:hypothetical protein